MLLFPFHRATPCPRGRSALTMVEMVVAMGVGSILILALTTLSLFSARSFVGISNYLEMDQASQNALDRLSRDIRQMAGLKNYSLTSLTFTNVDNSEFLVTWSPATRQLTSSQDGVTRTLLTQCDELRFNISQRNPSNGVFGFYPTTNPDLCKMVDVSWRCSRILLGKKMHTESVQTARIVIRN